MHGVLSPRFLGASLGHGVYHCIPVLTYSFCNGVVYACESDQYIQQNENCLTFSVRHLNAIKSTAGRSFLGIKPLPALQQM
jgi:hypothetical protein